MTISFKYIFGLIFVLVSQAVCSQQIKLNSIKEVKNDISAREYEVIDANGDASAIIKARISIDSVDFSTDLGINKIEEHDGEIWLWVPPGTKKLTIKSRRFNNLEFDLPGQVEEYSVHVVLFTVILEASKSYLDLPVLSVSTKPTQADVFINDIHYGKSPVSLSILPDSISYRLEKKRYNTISGTSYMSEEGQSLAFSLTKADTVNRIYLMANTDVFLPGRYNLGFTVGVIGDIGFYFRFVFPVKSVKSDFTYDNYYSEAPDPGDFDQYIRVLQISSGMTFRLSNKLFFTSGLSFGNRNTYISGEFISHEDGKIAFYREESYSPGWGPDLGFVLRIDSRFIFSVNNSFMFEQRQLGSMTDGYVTKQIFVNSFVNFGIGYNF